jgi:hypothetical protein
MGARMVKTIAEGVKSFTERFPQGIACVCVPMGDALAPDVNTVMIYTDRVSVPMVLGLDAALAVCFGSIQIQEFDDE